MPQRSRATTSTSATSSDLKIVVSDLHLGDGDSMLENWQPAQQAAWERLLAREDAAAGSRPVELVVNGDGFDLLAAGPPLDDHDATDIATARAKIAAVTEAHAAWCASLRAFLARPARTLTFTIGNHDVELAFAPVRAHLRHAIGAPAGTVRFCLARGYRPFPDVHIEHGCQPDAWNHIPHLWEGPRAHAWASPRQLETVDAPDAAAPGSGATPLALPWGSRYYYRVFRPIQRRFPYFDALLPTLPQAGILALLCLTAPELVVSGSVRARPLLAAPVATDGPPASAVAADPAALFAAVLPEVAGLQLEVSQDVQQANSAPDPDGMAAMLQYVMALHSGLQAGELPALRAIFDLPRAFTSVSGVMPADDAAAAADIFAQPTDPAQHEANTAVPRWGLIGHTHVEGAHDLPRHNRGPRHTLVNTGTWYTRLALPAPDAITPALAAWLRAPSRRRSPLAPATAFTYALVRGGGGARSTVTLRQAD